ncbi:MAG: HAD family hydrolase, partial [Desulfovibrio sp.]|nr:HAD family hydrolase [Desulfovibrio sp.]
MLKIHDPNVFTSPPRCILLDLDGTLYPYEPAHQAGMEASVGKAARHLGIARREVDAAFAVGREETKARLGATASSHNRLLYFSRGVELLGFRSQPLLALDLEQSYWWAFMINMALYDGVRQFLTTARNAGITLCLVTDLTAQIQYRKLCFLELDAFFDYIVTSEESGADKPDPASFNLALGKTGIPAERTWIIGDNYDTDIVGGKNAGLFTMLFC